MAFSPMESKPLSEFDPMGQKTAQPPQPQQLYSQYLNEELRRLRKRGLVLNETLLDGIADKILNRIEQEVNAWLNRHAQPESTDTQALQQPIDTIAATHAAVHASLQAQETDALHTIVHQHLSEQDTQALHQGVHQTLRQHDSKVLLETVRGEHRSTTPVTAKAS